MFWDFLHRLSASDAAKQSEPDPTTETPVLSPELQQELLSLARNSIRAELESGNPSVVPSEWLDRFPEARAPRGVFVTLTKAGQLRGCVGRLDPERPLFLAVQNAASKAAFYDTRFSPLTLEELSAVQVSISVLSILKKITVEDPAEFLNQLHPGRDGVVLFWEDRCSTFLPQVWEQLPDAKAFLSRLARKQGAPEDAWRRAGAQIFTFTTTSFGDG